MCSKGYCSHYVYVSVCLSALICALQATKRPMKDSYDFSTACLSVAILLTSYAVSLTGQTYFPGWSGSYMVCAEGFYTLVLFAHSHIALRLAKYSVVFNCIQIAANLHT